MSTCTSRSTSTGWRRASSSGSTPTSAATTRPRSSITATARALLGAGDRRGPGDEVAPDGAELPAEEPLDHGDGGGVVVDHPCPAEERRHEALHAIAELVAVDEELLPVAEERAQLGQELGEVAVGV